MREVGMEREMHDGKDGSLKGASPTTWVVRPDPDLEDLIPSFMQNRRNELQDIDGAVARGDFDAIRRIAHTWKGICRPYGFVHLETLSRNLEAAGERENTEETLGVASEIRIYLDNVRIVYEQ
jgi:chemotaxis protein histidine kinase CheA